MKRIALRDIWARKRRLTGSFIAVFLGVAFLTGTLVLADTLGTSIDGFFTRAYQGTDVSVRSSVSVSDEPGTQRGMIDASVLDRVRRVSGVAAAEPVIEGTGQLVGRDGRVIETQGPRTAGNWVADRDLNPYRVVEGRAPRAAGEVVINRRVARDGELRVGDRTAVLTPQRVPVTIVGISKFGDDDAFGGSSFTAFTLADAQWYVAQRPGLVSRVSVKAAPGVDRDALADRIKPVLGPGTEALTGDALAEEGMTTVNEQFVSVFRMVLTAFAGVALLVAAFSIHNTFTIQVAQRTRESALLRAIGGSRGQVVVLVAAEALAVAVVATLAGVAGGVGVAALLKLLFAGFGMGLPAQGLVFTLRTVLIAVPVGVVVTVLAALAPVVRASRVAPLAALRESAAESRGGSPARGFIGLALGVVAVAAVLWGALADAVAIASAGAAMCLLVMVVLAPVVARPAAAVLGRAARGGAGAALARRNAARNPRRTAGAATALMIGVGVVTLLTVFVGSLRASLEDDVAGSLRGDLVVGATDFGPGGLDPGFAAQVAALPQVEAAVGMGQGYVRIGQEGERVSVADPAQLSRVLGIGTVGDGFAVSQDAADEHGWRVGAAVPVTFADGGRQALRITAIYTSGDLAGDYLMPRTVWAAHTRQVLDSVVFVDLRDGADLAAAKTEIVGIARPHGGPEVRDRAEYVAAQTANINTFLNIVYVMLALAIVIALLGIANTLALSVHERVREIGLLRAVGASRRQIRAMVRWESVVVALFGTAGGIGLGVFLGWALSAAALDAVAAPAGQLTIIALVGVLAGVLAAIRPARRAARMPALTAIATP
jgi:putative ABC transport system permease protein